MKLPERLAVDPRWQIWVVLALAAFLSFWKLGDHAVFEWDEARYGEIAYWMVKSGDYINYQYAGEPDNWNAKPPLAVWLIAASYQMFGFNEWALRLPSALATIAFFAFFFQFVRIYQSANFALIASLILMSCKGIIGHHVGRTGDTDALLILCLMAFIYYAFRFLDFDEKKMVWGAAISLGLAFYVKGTAFIFYVPGVLLYAWFIGKFKKIFSYREVWAGIAIVFAMIASWYFIVTFMGQSFEDSVYLGSNSWEVLFLYDTFSRFFTPGLEGNPEDGANYLFFLSALDVKFNLWNYVAYIGMIWGGIKAWQNRENLKEWVDANEYNMFAISACIMLTLGLLLTVSQTKLIWYIAPLLPFAAIYAAQAVKQSSYWNGYMLVLWVGLGIFTMGRHFVYLDTVKQERGTFLRQYEEKLRTASQIRLFNAYEQDVRLYADWFNEKVARLQSWDQFNANEVVVAHLTENEQLEIQLIPNIQWNESNGMWVIWKKSD